MSISKISEWTFRVRTLARPPGLWEALAQEFMSETSPCSVAGGSGGEAHEFSVPGTACGQSLSEVCLDCLPRRVQKEK